jgi:hypothetical protein
MGQICGVDGQCRDECKADGDCVKGQVCTQGTCADTTELLDSGKLPVAADDAGIAGEGGGAPSTVPCLYNSDCPNGLICSNQVCVPECKEDIDCIFRGPGYSCMSGRCVPSGVSDAAAEASTTDGSAEDSTVSVVPDAGKTCTYNSDCTPQICQAGVCIDQCHADVDCAPGQTCNQSHVCVATGVSSQPEASVTDATAGCTYNSDCTPQICRAGVCIDQCHADIDCAPGQTCSSSHVCVVPEASVPPDAPTGYAAGCLYNSDCAYPLVCKSSGSCGYQCQTNLDCAPGNYCNGNHQCIAGAPPAVDAGTYDAGAVDAAAEAGKQCTYNSDCTDGVWCDGYETCVLGHCYPPAVTPCGTSATCIQTSCDEATHTCSQTRLGTTDADGDGHTDQACGGDDCNDNDPTIYLGHPELCDGKDNDCNGLVDDYAVVARGAEFTGVTSASERTLITSAFGTGLMTGKLLASSGTKLAVQTMTTAGVAGADTQISGTLSSLSNYSVQSGFAGVPGASPAALMVYNVDIANNQQTVRYATVITPLAVDGGTSYATSTPITLVPSGIYETSTWNGSDDADVHWTGSAFLVAWTYYGNYSANGYFTTVRTDGTQATSNIPVPTPATPDGGSPTGVLGNPVNGQSRLILRSAANGTLYAFIYGQWINASTAATTVYLTSTSGNTVAGPVVLPSAPLSIAPYGAGFVVLTQDTTALIMTQLSSTGAVLAQLRQTAMGSSAPGLADARGDQDAQGVAFVIKVSGGMRMVRARGNLTDPMEVTTPITPTSSGSSDRVDISRLADGTLGISYWEAAADGAVHTRIASCLPSQ